MTTTAKPDIRFIIDITPSKYSQALDLTATPVVIEDGKIRNPSFGWSDHTGTGEYDGLKLSARCDVKDSDFCFGFDLVTFEATRVDLRRAEAMVKTLRRIEKRLERMNQDWGRPTDYAGFLSHVAKAVGCGRNAFGVKVSGAGWSYDDNEYRWMDVDSLRYHLERKITEWKGEE